MASGECNCLGKRENFPIGYCLNMMAYEREMFNDNVETIYPLGRIGNPNDISGLAFFLASEQSKWITGSLVSVDGGLTTNSLDRKISQ